MFVPVQKLSAYALGSLVLADGGFNVLGAEEIGADVLVRLAPPEVEVLGIPTWAAVGIGALGLGVLAALASRH